MCVWTGQLPGSTLWLDCESSIPTTPVGFVLRYRKRSGKMISSLQSSLAQVQIAEHMGHQIRCLLRCFPPSCPDGRCVFPVPLQHPPATLDVLSLPLMRRATFDLNVFTKVNKGDRTFQHQCPHHTNSVEKLLLTSWILLVQTFIMTEMTQSVPNYSDVLRSLSHWEHVLSP